MRYQIKGLSRGLQRGRQDIDSFTDPADAIDTAKAVAEQDYFDRVLVVDGETWHGAIAAGAVGIVWDSDAETPAT